MATQAIQDKYRIFWLLGACVSFALYFSGIISCYIFFRKRLLKKYRTIVLTYHRIRDDEKDPDISVSTSNFNRQMEYLKHNFEVVSLNTLIANVEPKTRKADRAAITFDDGYKDNFLNAYPVFKKHDLPATIFLVSKQLGNSEKTLSIDEIKNMKSGKITFGSHTATHPVLTEINIQDAAREIQYSKTDLEKLLGEKVQFFAYPKGKKSHFNKQITEIVKAAGYKAAFTTENGEIAPNSDLFELKRIGIRNCPLFVFKVRVSGIFENRLAFFVRNLLRLT